MRLRTLLCCCFGLLQGAHAQWQLQQAKTQSDLFSVHALSEQVAWASGAEGTVLHTSDGGETWQRCALPAGAEHLDFRAVQGFTASMALVMSSGKGELSRIYKTADGCQSWTLVLTNPDPEGVWQSMQFRWNPGQPPAGGYFSAGVLLGRPVEGAFPIYTSKDYGTTWRSLQEDEAYAPGPTADARTDEALLALIVAALTTTTEDNTFAFVTGGAGGGRLVFPQGHSYDFNNVSARYTFADVRLPLAAGSAAAVYAVGSRRTATGVDLMVVGGDGQNAAAGSAVLVHRTGLKRFFAPTATASLQPPHGLRTAVGFDEGSHTWVAVGPNGTDVSQDDGRTWTALVAASADESVAGFGAMSLPFAVGAGGRVGRFHGGAGRVPTMETAKAGQAVPQGTETVAAAVQPTSSLATASN